MLVQCPSCRTTYRISDQLVATPSPTFRCSRCKHIFVLGVKSEAAPASPPTPPPAAPARAVEGELPFSAPEAKKTEATEVVEAEPPAPPADPEPPAAPPSPEAEPASAPTSPASQPLAIQNGPTSPQAEAAQARPKEETEREPQPAAGDRKEERWSLATVQAEAEEHFSMPDEDGSVAAAPDFDADWPDGLPLLENRESASGTDAYRDRPLSILPYVGLFGALLLIFSLFTLMYQARPEEIESAIKTIPWLGPALLKNNHLRYGISLQSVRPAFQSIQGNREVFVLAGVAVNRNPVSVREIRVEGQIFNAEGKEMDRQTISVGNAISAAILRDLTAQEISILQKLNPQKRFEVLPDESAAFAIVFLKPAGEVKNFSCRVLSVEGAA